MENELSELTGVVKYCTFEYTKTSETDGVEFHYHQVELEDGAKGLVITKVKHSPRISPGMTIVYQKVKNRFKLINTGNSNYTQENKPSFPYPPKKKKAKFNNEGPDDEKLLINAYLIAKDLFIAGFDEQDMAKISRMAQNIYAEINKIKK